MDVDDTPAKQLWDLLEELYSQTKAQPILDLKHELDDLKFNDKKNSGDDLF